MPSWGYNQPQYANQPYGSTGYQANAQITIDDVILDSAQRCIDNDLARRNIDQNAAAYMFSRVQQELPALRTWVQRNCLSNGNQLDTDIVTNWLSQEPLPVYFNEFMSQNAQRPAAYGSYNQTAGNNRAPIWSNQGIANSNIGYASGIGSRSMNSAELAATQGIGKILPTRQTNNNNNNNQPVQSNYNNTQMPTCDAKTIMEPLVNALLKGRPNKKIRQEQNICIDKITSNTDNILYNDEFLINSLSDPNIPDVEVIGAYGANSLLSGAEIIQDIVPNCAEGCTVTSQQTIACSGTSIDLTSVELHNPVNNVEEAVSYVKDSVQNFGNQERWVTSIEYNELCVKQLPGHGTDVKKTVLDISNKISQLTSLQDISSQIVPILAKSNEQVRNYLNALIFDKINKLFKLALFVPNNPTIYPMITSWEPIFILAKQEYASENSYIKEMFTVFGDEYPKLIFHCVKKALTTIFNPDEDNLIISSDGTDRGILARTAGLNVTAGKYHVSDYGIMPDQYWKTISDKINNDYIVHKYKQSILVTNMAVKEHLSSNSRYTIIKGMQTILQFVIGSILSAVKQIKQYPEDILLVEYNKEGTSIEGIYSIGQNLHDEILITKL